MTWVRVENAPKLPVKFSLETFLLFNLHDYTRLGWKLRRNILLWWLIKNIYMYSLPYVYIFDILHTSGSKKKLYHSTWPTYNITSVKPPALRATMINMEIRFISPRKSRTQTQVYSHMSPKVDKSYYHTHTHSLAHTLFSLLQDHHGRHNILLLCYIIHACQEKANAEEKVNMPVMLLSIV